MLTARWGGAGGRGTPILGQYGYVPPPESPSFFFQPGTLRKTPVFKNMHLFVPLFRPGLLQKIPFKNVRFSVIFSSKIPLFFSEGSL